MSNAPALCAIVLSIAVLPATSPAAELMNPNRAENHSRLEPYTHCDGFADGVRGVTLDRRPQTAEPWRALDSSNNGERVSVIDGYRVTYSYARTFAFANLKAERSDPSRYAEDKRILTAEFVEMAKADSDLELVNFSHGGYTGQTLTKRQLTGRALGKSQMFSDDDAVIVTIYFLNHEPENRNFQTLEEFVALRDAFVRGYIDCVASRKRR